MTTLVVIPDSAAMSVWGIIARQAGQPTTRPFFGEAEVVEEAPVETLFTAPAHPYTRLLLRAIPSARRKQETLPVIDGTAPAASAIPPGCRFHTRCPLAADICRRKEPELVDMVLLRNSRLSVQPVSEAEWQIVCGLAGISPD